MSDIITNTTSTNESKVFNVYVSKSTTAGTALVTRGSLNKTDPKPTVVGLYILEETGIYPNLGNIDAKAGKLNFAIFDGTTWKLIAVDMPVQENFAETQNLVTTGTVIYNYASDGVLTSAANPSVGINPKKDGSYEQAWEIFSVKNPVKVFFGQEIRIEGRFIQPWSINGLDKNFQFVKSLAFNDSTPTEIVNFTIDNPNIEYIIFSCHISKLSNFKAISLNTPEQLKPNENKGLFAEDFTIVEGKYCDFNNSELAQSNLSYFEFSVEPESTYRLDFHQYTGFCIGVGENNKLPIDVYGRQTSADSSLYRTIIISPSNGVKKIKISFDRDYEHLLRLEKISTNIKENQTIQEFSNFQNLIESDYKGSAIVGGNFVKKLDNENFITDFIRKEKKDNLIFLNSENRKPSLTLISDSFNFPILNAYGSGTADDGFFKGATKDNIFVGYHYGVPQVSIDEGNTWVLLKNPDDSKIDMLGRIDNIFICENKDLIIEYVIDGETNAGLNHYIKRLKFVGNADISKSWVDDGIKLTISGQNPNDVYISPFWGFWNYKNLILLSEYGKQGSGGATHVYLSQNNGETFSTILDLSDSAQLSTINSNLNFPMVQKSYGTANGLHIHGVSYDDIQGRIYVTIGDGGLEGSHILWSDDLGVTWKGHLYKKTFAMPRYTISTYSQSLQVYPFSNHLLVTSDELAQGFFLMNRTSKNEIPEISWWYDITKTGESKFWDEGAGISFKPYMISNHSKFSENQPLYFATAVHHNSDLIAGLRNKVVATYDGLNFSTVWELKGPEVNNGISPMSEVYATQNYLFIKQLGRTGKLSYLKFKV